MGSPSSLTPRLPPGVSSAARGEDPAWPAAAGFASHGVTIGVRSNDARVIEELKSLLPPASCPQPLSSVDHWLSVGVKEGAGPSELTRVLRALESALRLKVAEASPERIFVHAGVVGWRGRAILVPGRSRSGKTTLVAELVKAGACYLSDEFAPLDGLGRVHPFPKPLTIRVDGSDLHVHRCAAEELGGSACRESLPVALVAFAEHQPGASWGPEKLTRGHGVLEMLAHTVPARLRPEASLEALDRALAGATLLRGARGEADVTARLLIETIEAEAEAAAAEGGS